MVDHPGMKDLEVHWQVRWGQQQTTQLPVQPNAEQAGGKAGKEVAGCTAPLSDVPEGPFGQLHSDGGAIGRTVLGLVQPKLGRTWSMT